MPVSRTPEGDFIHCEVCGQSSLIEASQPTKDVPCPICGSLAWATERRSQPPESAKLPQSILQNSPSMRIRQFVRGLDVLASRRTALDLLYEELVRGTVQCLAAHGGALWLNPKKHWFSGTREKALEFTCGTFRVNDGFSASVAQQFLNDPDPPTLTAEDPDSGHLHLCVGIMRSKSVNAILHIIQRPNSQPVTRRGYIRFMQQVTNIAAKSSQFGQTT